MIRSPTAKSLLLVGGGVLDLLRKDSAAGRLAVVNTGVRLFERETAVGAQCTYRLCQDGCRLLMPHLTRQVARVSSMALVEKLLRQRGGQNHISLPEIVELDPELARQLGGGEGGGGGGGGGEGGGAEEGDGGGGGGGGAGGGPAAGGAAAVATGSCQQGSVLLWCEEPPHRGSGGGGVCCLVSLWTGRGLGLMVKDTEKKELLWRLGCE